MLFSEPKIPQSLRIPSISASPSEFQCSSASRKFLNCAERAAIRTFRTGFSALQRAENSSMPLRRRRREHRRSFSALQRAENSSMRGKRKAPQLLTGFSALQRAENSSIAPAPPSLQLAPRWFQCSSASRKFLNGSFTLLSVEATATFQCSSASRKFLNTLGHFAHILRKTVSVLFSEPKIPQCR